MNFFSVVKLHIYATTPIKTNSIDEIITTEHTESTEGRQRQFLLGVLGVLGGEFL
ncbi:MAG: hypothetical protein RLZZ453_1198 [Chlamydiota bacterium]|jgi:hypothetical protein